MPMGIQYFVSFSFTIFKMSKNTILINNISKQFIENKLKIIKGTGNKETEKAEMICVDLLPPSSRTIKPDKNTTTEEHKAGIVLIAINESPKKSFIAYKTPIENGG
jgi:hypothetical protein